MRAFHTRFPFGCVPSVLNLAHEHNSSDRSTKSTPSHLNVLRLLVNTGFQGLFHSPSGVLFTVPSQYFFTIGYHGVFRLGGWSPRLPTGFLVSRRTLVLLDFLRLRVRDFYSLWSRLSFRSFRSPSVVTLQSSTPINQGRLVWPLPLSLATTHGISFDFSSWSYLDVSVHSVFPTQTMDSFVPDRAFTPAGFPHSDIRGSSDICSFPQLFAACRVLLRLMVPRHSPCALCNLTCMVLYIDHAHCFTASVRLKSRHS